MTTEARKIVESLLAGKPSKCLSEFGKLMDIATMEAVEFKRTEVAQSMFDQKTKTPKE